MNNDDKLKLFLKNKKINFKKEEEINIDSLKNIFINKQNYIESEPFMNDTNNTLKKKSKSINLEDVIQETTSITSSHRCAH